MQTSPLVCLCLLSLIPTIVAVTCTGATAALTSWCMNNCNNNPPYCPSSTCSCVSPSKSASPSKSPAPVSILSTMGYYESHACCVDADAVMYYVNTGSVYMRNLDANNKPEGNAILCANSPAWVGAVDVTLDQSGGIYVADFLDGKLWYVAPYCATKTLVYNYHVTGIPPPTTVSITSNGNLLVGIGNQNIYKIVVNPSTRALVSYTVLSSTNAWLDAAVVGNNAFVSTLNTIYRVDTTKTPLQFTTYFHSNLVPDIQGVVATTECGLFFAANDNHQIWHCSDLLNGASCTKYCSDAGIDASTCADIRDPFGLAMDCHCNVFVTNKGDGTIVLLNTDGSEKVIVSGLFHPQGIAVYVPTGNCGVTPSSSASSSPSSSASPSLSASASPSPSSSASPSLSASASPSPSSSASPSLSASASPSPSSSASPSLSASASPSATGSHSATASPSATTSVSPSSSTSATPSSSATSSHSSTASSSPSSSETSSASRSATSSSSLTASSSPTLSESPSPSASPSESASASVSITASVSATVSASPSPLFTFAMDVNDMNAACAQGSCPGVDDTILAQVITASSSSRVVGVVTYISHKLPAGSSTTICNAGTLGSTCIRVAALADITNTAAAVAGVKLFVKSSQNPVPPSFSVPLAFMDAGAFPNIYLDKSGIFGVIDCTGYNGVNLVLSVTQPRLCWNDSYFAKVICHTGSSNAREVTASDYVDAEGNTLVLSNPHKTLQCTTN